MKQIESGQKTLSPTRLVPLILFITTILTLAMSGVAVAKKCDNPPCGGGGGGDDSSNYYDVTITGSMGGAGEYWMSSTNGQVNYQHFDPLPSTGVLNLAFFRDYFAANGNTCFPAGDAVPIHSVILSYKKRTGAQARIWFHGSTYQDNISVVYVLTINGVLDKRKWPPAEGTSNRMELNTWKMRLANEGSANEAISCLKEDGDFTSASGQVDIDVSSVPPPSP